MARGSSPPPSRYLAIYLNDHLAGSTTVVERVKRATRAYSGTELGAFLTRLLGEIRADRHALRGVMASVGARPQRAKLALAWLGEKAGRLKLNGRVIRRSPLSPFVELEAMEIGVYGKLLLWRALRADGGQDVGDPATFDALIARAERQLAGLERHRIPVGLRAFGGRRTRIGIIGSGHVGGTLTRRLRALGHDVAVANSRGPESLRDLASETGARPATVDDAARGADVVVLAVPLGAVPSLPARALAGKVVIDANNYYPSRDGRIADLDAGTPSSRWLAQQLPDANVVKAFNTIRSQHLGDGGRPRGDDGRIALPVAGDDAAAKRTVMGLVDALGFDPVDAGGLDESWRLEPETPVYGSDRDAAGVRAGLATAQRGS